MGLHPTCTQDVKESESVLQIFLSETNEPNENEA